jgi:CDP-glycerol glycerophosphotransferase (TagB/SpsB family)
VLKKENVNLYELMAHTDALLSDYSSAAVDYLLLDKPMGFILTDFDEYEKARSWCYDNVKDYMPGHHIYTAEDLREFLADTAAGRDAYAEARAKVLPELQTQAESYSRNVLDYFGITLKRDTP